MPALSQSLQFTVNNTSTVILNYPNTGTEALVYSSDPVKGDGYYGRSDGIHTAQIQLTDFIGKVEIQGSLASVPSTNDWFTVELGTGNASVDTTGLIREENITYISYFTATSIINSYNFTGNYVWVRATVSEWTEGTVNSIKINH